MKNLYFLFPQWQGSGESQELYRGAKLLQQELSKDFSFVEADVSLSATGLELKNGIFGYEIIKQQLSSAIKTVEQAAPEKIFTIGGDCSIEIAPIAYLNKKYNGNVAIIWLDAHGDLLVPLSFPYEQFHGMPLRTLLDEGDEAIRGMLSSKLKLPQIFLAGVRDLDPPEKEYVKNENIPLFNVENLSTESHLLIDSIRSKGFEKIFIHLDLDVLDPVEFPDIKCPTVRGISVEKLINLIRELKNNFTVVGGSVVEFSPKEDKNIEVVKSLVKELFDK